MSSEGPVTPPVKKLFYYGLMVNKGCSHGSPRGDLHAGQDAAPELLVVLSSFLSLFSGLLIDPRVVRLPVAWTSHSVQLEFHDEIEKNADQRSSGHGRNILMASTCSVQGASSILFRL